MKGSLNAFDFAGIVEKAFLESNGDFIIRKLPVADGGDFTGEVLSRNLNAKTVFVEVQNPFGEKIKSKYAVFENTAIIEMADASGMKLVDRNLLNPLIASSFGTGQLIADAVKNGCTEILLAVGGSATVDGGMGMMEALGFHFFDKNGNMLTGNGRNLSNVNSILKPKELPAVSIKIICDVDNLLLGKNGAATVFAPQKGATPKMVTELETGLKNWARIITNLTGSNSETIKGSGAAGGIAVPLLAFYSAEIVLGADFVLDQLNFSEHVKWADIVITGEGKIDEQTVNNKVPFVVAKMAHKYNKPVFAICGIVDDDDEKLPFNKVVTLVSESVNESYSIKNANSLLYNVSVELVKTISLNKK
jgi:glycerate kinase